MIELSASTIAFEELPRISITDLKSLGLLKSDGYNLKTVSYSICSSYGQVKAEGSFEIFVNLEKGMEYIEFDYQYLGQRMNYRISLTIQKSNLGKGDIFYFKCAETDIKCKKLHLFNGRFMHRKAISKGYYGKELYSRKWKPFYRLNDQLARLGKAIALGERKYHMRYYKACSTKKQNRIWKATHDKNRLERISCTAIIPTDPRINNQQIES